MLVLGSLVWQYFMFYHQIKHFSVLTIKKVTPKRLVLHFVPVTAAPNLLPRPSRPTSLTLEVMEG